MSGFALNALARKRAELLRESEGLQARLDQIRVDVLHLDAALRTMDPDKGTADPRGTRDNHKGTGWLVRAWRAGAEHPGGAARRRAAADGRGGGAGGDGAPQHGPG